MIVTPQTESPGEATAEKRSADLKASGKLVSNERRGNPRDLDREGYDEQAYPVWIVDENYSAGRDECK